MRIPATPSPAEHRSGLITARTSFVIGPVEEQLSIDPVHNCTSGTFLVNFDGNKCTTTSEKCNRKPIFYLKNPESVVCFFTAVNRAFPEQSRSLKP